MNFNHLCYGNFIKISKCCRKHCWFFSKFNSNQAFCRCSSTTYKGKYCLYSILITEATFGQFVVCWSLASLWSIRSCSAPRRPSAALVVSCTPKFPEMCHLHCTCLLVTLGSWWVCARTCTNMHSGGFKPTSNDFLKTQIIV